MSKLIKKTTTEKYDKEGHLTERIIEEVTNESDSNTNSSCDCSKKVYDSTRTNSIWSNAANDTISDWLKKRMEDNR